MDTKPGKLTPFVRLFRLADEVAVRLVLFAARADATEVLDRLEDGACCLAPFCGDVLA